MGIRNTVEYLYLALMLRWEDSAPPDRHEGLLDSELARNTQITRLAYIVRKIAAGQEDRVYRKLSRHSQRNDGRSYVSTDPSWMTEPHPLSTGWHFEGCTSLKQKQDLVQALSKVDISPALIAAIDDFVSGKSVRPHLPTDEEAEELLRLSIEQEEREQGSSDA